MVSKLQIWMPTSPFLMVIINEPYIIRALFPLRCKFEENSPRKELDLNYLCRIFLSFSLSNSIPLKCLSTCTWIIKEYISKKFANQQEHYFILKIYLVFIIYGSSTLNNLFGTFFKKSYIIIGEYMLFNEITR